MSGLAVHIEAVASDLDADAVQAAQCVQRARANGRYVRALLLHVDEDPFWGCADLGDVLLAVEQQRVNCVLAVVAFMMWARS